MDILFGKLKIKVKPEHADTKATISTTSGFTKEVDLVAPETNVILPGLEEYVITFAVNGAVQTFKLGYGEIVVCTSGWIIPPWSSATWDEIADVCDRYYNDEITLDEIKEVWSVGDRKDVNLSAMLATYNLESHVAQTIELEIIDFEHDSLIHATNGHTKALITIQQHSVLSSNSSTAVNGKISASSVNHWVDSDRRKWCNNTYKGALPEKLRDVLKLTSHVSDYGGTDAAGTVNAEYVFFLAASEIDRNSGVNKEKQYTTLYKYYENSINKKKYVGYKDTGNANSWWTRSGVSSYTSRGDVFWFVRSEATFDHNMCTNTYGIAPAMCL